MKKELNYSLFKITIFILLTLALLAMVSSPAKAEVMDPAPLIDIKPGSHPNAVNIGRNGVLPAAILGSEGFDVETVNRESIMFGFDMLREPDYVPVEWIQPIRVNVSDVNGDGIPDLIFHFSMADVNSLYDTFVFDTVFVGDPYILGTIKFSVDDEDYMASEWLFIPKLYNNGKKK